MREFIDYDSDRFNDVSRLTRQMSAYINIPTDNNPILTGKLLGEGVQKLRKSFEIVSNKMNGVSNIVDGQMSSFFQQEMEFAKELSSITVPSGYKISDIRESFTTDTTNNNAGEKIKLDIPQKEAIGGPTELDDYSIEKQELDISNKEESHVVDAVNIDTIEKEKLEDINKNGSLQKQEYKDNNDFEEENLKNINNNYSGELVEIADFSRNVYGLDDINKNPTLEESSIADEMDNISLEQTNLTDISNNAGEVLDIEDTKIKEKQLDNLNNNYTGEINEINNISVNDTNLENMGTGQANIPPEIHIATFGDKKSDNDSQNIEIDNNQSINSNSYDLDLESYVEEDKDYLYD